MQKKARRTLIWIAAGSLLLAIGAALARHDRTEQLVWIKTSDLAAHFRPGFLTRLKFKILRLPGPFWQMYARGRTQVVIDARLVAVGPDSFPLPELPAQHYTNEDGVRAWVLSREELAQLKRELKALPGYDVVHDFRLTTLAGFQARLSSVPPAQGPSGRKRAFGGVTIDLLPTVLRHRFDLNVGATCTEAIGARGDSFPAVVTNLAVGCLAGVPNGGGLVFQAPPHHDLLATNYWLLICPVAIDASGNQKEL